MVYTCFMEKDKNGLTEKQSKYVAARLAGKPVDTCKIEAGYYPTQASGRIEKPGGNVWLAIRKALSKQGLSDNFIAKELRAGIERSKTAITRFNPKTGEAVKDPDLAALDRYLGRICKLKGYEREPNITPQVAVQINQQFPGVENINIGTVEKLVDAIEAEIKSRESADVLEADIGNTDAAACPDLDKPGGETQKPAGS